MVARGCHSHVDDTGLAGTVGHDSLVLVAKDDLEESVKFLCYSPLDQKREDTGGGAYGNAREGVKRKSSSASAIKFPIIVAFFVDACADTTSGLDSRLGSKKLVTIHQWLKTKRGASSVASCWRKQSHFFVHHRSENLCMFLASKVLPEDAISTRKSQSGKTRATKFFEGYELAGIK